MSFPQMMGYSFSLQSRKRFVDIKELIYIQTTNEVANVMREANTLIPHLVFRTNGLKGTLQATVQEALRARR